MRRARLKAPEMQTSYKVSLARVRDLEMSCSGELSLGGFHEYPAFKIPQI